MVDKNKRKMDAKRHRVFVSMNTGTRTHKSKVDYDRQAGKQLVRDLAKYAV